jgi:predicted Zn-dependent peptidase
MDDFLTGSRSSRTYRNLVEKSTALSVSTYATYPGEKHATQMLCYAIPAPGVSFDTLDTSLQREVEYLLEKGPSEEELMQYKKVCMSASCLTVVAIKPGIHVLFLFQSSSVGILGITQTNSSMASALSVYENLTGSWRNIYRELDEISRLNSYDIRTTASQYLTPSNSFVAYISR